MKKTVQTELNFEDAMKRMEEIVSSLERGDAPLEESIRLFEEGMTISKFCSEKLKAAEGTVQKLIEAANNVIALEPLSLNNKEEYQ